MKTYRHPHHKITNPFKLQLHKLRNLTIMCFIVCEKISNFLLLIVPFPDFMNSLFIFRLKFHMHHFFLSFVIILILLQEYALRYLPRLLLLLWIEMRMTVYKTFHRFNCINRIYEPDKYVIFIDIWKVKILKLVWFTNC